MAKVSLTSRRLEVWAKDSLVLEGTRVTVRASSPPVLGDTGTDRERSGREGVVLEGRAGHPPPAARPPAARRAEGTGGNSGRLKGTMRKTAQ